MQDLDTRRFGPIVVMVYALGEKRLSVYIPISNVVLD